MIAQPQDGENVTSFGKPENWDDGQDGHCYALAVRREVHGRLVHHISQWKPTVEELMRLNRGAIVELTCVSVQPPVAIRVIEPVAALLSGGDYARG